jgi:hypothetical protein
LALAALVPFTEITVTIPYLALSLRLAAAVVETITLPTLLGKMAALAVAVGSMTRLAPEEAAILRQLPHPKETMAVMEPLTLIMAAEAVAGLLPLVETAPMARRQLVVTVVLARPRQSLAAA